MSKKVLKALNKVSEEVFGKPCVSEAQFDKIWEGLLENNKKLQGCVGPHEFGECKGDTSTCKRCGGELRQDKVKWYLLGLEHGKKLRE